MIRTYFVTAGHVHPDYAFDKTPVEVRDTPISATERGFYARHPKLGCGKTFREPKDAILHLFLDHACRNIRIEAARFEL